MQLIQTLKCIPKRYIVTLLAFIGHFWVTYLQLNLSIAIPEMTSTKNISRGNDTEIINAEFTWNSVETGYILSAFSVGGLFSVLGGFIVPKTGGVIVVGIGVIISSIITIISPFLIRTDFYTFIVSRAVLGCVEGLAHISLMDVFTHWAPPDERARLVAFAYSGGIWSIAVNFPLSGLIIGYFDWETLFYVSGFATLIWCVVWLIFVGNKPSCDRFITDKEREYLMKQINYISADKDGKVNIPWKQILKSMPVYAILNEMFVASFTASFLGLLPLYVNDLMFSSCRLSHHFRVQFWGGVLTLGIQRIHQAQAPRIWHYVLSLLLSSDVFHTDIQSVGFISGLPILCGCFAVPIAGFVADRLRVKFSDVSKVNRLYIFWGELGTLIFLFAAALWGTLYGCFICLCLITMSYSVADSSYQVICIDIAGQFAGTLRALTGITSSLSFILNPVIVGYMTPDHTQSEWNIYFGFLGVMTVYGVIMFFIFGSSDLQPWAEVDRIEVNNSIKTQANGKLEKEYCHQENDSTHL